MPKRTTINRRDFINGSALSLALGTTLSPLEILANTSGDSGIGYPPALTGMRGSTQASTSVAHALALDNRRFTPPKHQSEATYDLIVVGAGISGLSAAKFFRDRADGPSKILILDNHDDFGGHARRNEFTVAGKTLLSYGGSVALENPSKYSPVAGQLLKDLAIDYQRFYDYYDQDFYSNRGLQGGIFFDKATFGSDRLLLDPGIGIRARGRTSEQLAQEVAALPIPEEDKPELVRLLKGGVDYLAGKTVDEKIQLLNNISYLDYLKQYAGMPDSVLRLMRDSYLMLISVGWEAESALYAAYSWFPGTWELDILGDEEYEPFIFHFPDGNAGVARALVRELIPGAIPGSTMEDLVTARADYSLLDQADADVRLRLNSTAVNLQNTADGKFADVTYVRDGEAVRARARHVVMAGYNGIIPHICPEAPPDQVEALKVATKIPFVVGSVAIRNWRAFDDAGFSAIHTPGDVYFKDIFLGHPVSMGDHKFGHGPDDPMVLTMWHSPTTPGLNNKEQHRAGRAKLLQTSFAQFEQDIYAHLDSALSSYGFDAEREIVDITLNRWAHGYASEYEGIGMPLDYGRNNGPHIAGRAQIGRISIANSDSEAYAYVNGAIDAADRAVNEQLS